MMEFLKLHNFELQKTSKYFQTNDAFKNGIFSLICITVHSSKFFHVFISFFNSGVCVTTEAAVGRRSSKSVFLRISQNSRKKANKCVGVSFSIALQR